MKVNIEKFAHLQKGKMASVVWWSRNKAVHSMP